MNYEEARLIIRDVLSSILTADKLTKKQFIELEDALSQKAYDIYRAVEREHHKEDVLLMLAEDDSLKIPYDDKPMKVLETVVKII
jgi:hypothetical protein